MTHDQWLIHRNTHTKQNSWWLRDAKGIECCRVCDTPGCEAAAKSRYNPAIFNASEYDAFVEEPIEPEDDDEWSPAGNDREDFHSDG